MYILETPIHFAMIIASLIVVLILALLSFSSPITKEKNLEYHWLSFLVIFFLVGTYAILAAMIYLLPAAATADQLLPYYLGAWSCVALYGFFLVFFAFSSKSISAPAWIKYLFLLATLSFLAVLWFFTTPTTAFVVSDGLLSWLAMPWIVVIYGAILAVLYLFIIPFIHSYRVISQQEGGMKTGNLIALVGLLLWTIAAMGMALVFFVAPFMLGILALGFVGLLLTFIGLMMFTRAKPKSK